MHEENESHLPHLADKSHDQLIDSSSKDVRVRMGKYMNRKEFEKYLKKGHKIKLS